MSEEQCIYSLFDIVSYCLQLLELNDLPKFWSIEDNERSFVFTALWGCGIEVDCMAPRDHELALESAMHSVKAKLNGLYSILLQTVQILGYDDCWRSWNMRGFNGRFRCKSVWDKQMQGDLKIKDDKGYGFFNSPNLIFKILGFSLESLGVTTQNFWLLEERNFKLKFTSSWQWHKKPDTGQSPRSTDFSGKLGEIFKVLKHSVAVLKLKETPDVWKFEFGNRSLQFTLLWSHLQNVDQDFDVCEGSESSRSKRSDLDSSYELIEGTQEGTYCSGEEEVKNQPNGSFTNSHRISETMKNSEFNLTFSDRVSTEVGSLHTNDIIPGGSETLSSVSNQIENEDEAHEPKRDQSLHSQYSPSTDSNRQSTEWCSEGVKEREFDEDIQKKSDILSWLGLVSDPTLQEKFVFEVDTKVKKNQHGICYGKEYEDAENSDCIDSYMKLSFESGIELDDVLQSDVGRLNRKQLNIPSIYVVDLSDNSHQDTVVVSLVDEYDQSDLNHHQQDTSDVLIYNPFVGQDINISTQNYGISSTQVHDIESYQMTNFSLPHLSNKDKKHQQIERQSRRPIDSGIASQTSQVSLNEHSGDQSQDPSKSLPIGKDVSLNGSDIMSSVSKTSSILDKFDEEQRPGTEKESPFGTKEQTRSFVDKGGDTYRTGPDMVSGVPARIWDTISSSERAAAADGIVYQSSPANGSEDTFQTCSKTDELRLLQEKDDEAVDKTRHVKQLPARGHLISGKMGERRTIVTKESPLYHDIFHHDGRLERTEDESNDWPLLEKRTEVAVSDSEERVSDKRNTRNDGDRLGQRALSVGTPSDNTCNVISESGLEYGAKNAQALISGDVICNTLVVSGVPKGISSPKSDREVGIISLSDKETKVSTPVTSRTLDMVSKSPLLDSQLITKQGYNVEKDKVNDDTAVKGALKETADVIDASKQKQFSSDYRIIDMESIDNNLLLNSSNTNLDGDVTQLINESKSDDRINQGTLESSVFSINDSNISSDKLTRDEKDFPDGYNHVAENVNEYGSDLTDDKPLSASDFADVHTDVLFCKKEERNVLYADDVDRESTRTVIKPLVEVHEDIAKPSNQSKRSNTKFIDEGSERVEGSLVDSDHTSNMESLRPKQKDSQTASFASPDISFNTVGQSEPSGSHTPFLVSVSSSSNTTEFNERVPDGSFVNDEGNYSETRGSFDHKIVTSQPMKQDKGYVTATDSFLYEDEFKFIFGYSDDEIIEESSENTLPDEAEPANVNTSHTYMFCCSDQDSGGLSSILSGIPVHAGSKVIIGEDVYKVVEIQENTLSFPSLLTNLTNIGKRITLLKPTRDGKHVRNSWDSLCFWKMSVSYHPDETLLDEASDVMVTSNFQRELVIGSKILEALAKIEASEFIPVVLVTDLPRHEHNGEGKPSESRKYLHTMSSSHFKDERAEDQKRHGDATPKRAVLKTQNSSSEHFIIDDSINVRLLQRPQNLFNQLFPSLHYKRYLIHLPRSGNDSMEKSLTNIIPRRLFNRNIEHPDENTSSSTVHANDNKCLRYFENATTSGSQNSQGEELASQVLNVRDSSSFCLRCDSWSCLPAANAGEDSDRSDLSAPGSSILNDTDSLSSSSDSSSVTLMWDAGTQTLIPAKRTPTGSKIPRYVPLSKRKKIRLFSKYLHQDLTMLHPPIPGSPGGSRVFIPANYSYMPSAKILKRLSSDSDVSYNYGVAWDTESRYRTYRRNSYDREKMRQMVGMYSHYVEEFNLYKDLIQAEGGQGLENKLQNRLQGNNESSHDLISTTGEECKDVEDLSSPRSDQSWSSETSLASDKTYDIKNEVSSGLTKQRPVISAANSRLSDAGIRDPSSSCESDDAGHLEASFSQASLVKSSMEIKIPEIFITAEDEYDLKQDQNGNSDEFRKHDIVEVISDLLYHEKSKKTVSEEEKTLATQKHTNYSSIIVAKERRNAEQRGTLVRRRVFVHKKAYLLYKLEILKRLKSSFSHARDIYQLMHFITGDYVDRIWPPTKSLLRDLTVNKKYITKRLRRNYRRKMIAWPKTIEESNVNMVN